MTYERKKATTILALKFGQIASFKYLKGIHLNNSKPDLGSRVDRHENLGKGNRAILYWLKSVLTNDSRIVFFDAYCDSVYLLIKHYLKKYHV